MHSAQPGRMSGPRSGRRPATWPPILKICTCHASGSVARMRHVPTGAIIAAEPPERDSVGTSPRSSYQKARDTKLTSEQIDAIQQRPPHPLRELAAQYGVSHETIRTAPSASSNSRHWSRRFVIASIYQSSLTNVRNYANVAVSLHAAARRRTLSRLHRPGKSRRRGVRESLSSTAPRRRRIGRSAFRSPRR